MGISLLILAGPIHMNVLFQLQRIGFPEQLWLPQAMATARAANPISATLICL